MYAQDASWLDTAGRLLLLAFFLSVGIRNLQKHHVEDHIKRAMVLFNWHPAIGVLLLLVFTIVASALLLRFWEVEGPMRTGLQNGMLANIGIVGGLLLLLQHVR